LKRRGELQPVAGFGIARAQFMSFSVSLPFLDPMMISISTPAASEFVVEQHKNQLKPNL
jgi:hypothetical protein